MALGLGAIFGTQVTRQLTFDTTLFQVVDEDPPLVAIASGDGSILVTSVNAFSDISSDAELCRQLNVQVSV